MFNDTYEDEPEWNATNCNKKEGDTTFDICGWCEYRGGGSYRYNCMLSGYCSLMKDYGDERNVKWDTLCKIKSLGPIDLQSIIKSKKWQIETNEQHITKLKGDIEVLISLVNMSQFRPPLPSNRPCDYYNEGEGIWVFHNDEWVHGIVVSGYRHHDGCVSYILDDYPESQPDKKGPWGCGYAVPGILKDEEMKYFRKHPKDFETYCNLSDKEYNGEKAPMAKMQDTLLR